MEFKDLFSTQATDYKKFRPTYPKELFNWIADKAPAKDVVWDCGTGNGQAAQELVKSFDSVKATDPSEKQLSEAVQNPNIDYRQASAEDSTLAPHSISVITVAQAFHWFDHERFFKEVQRVAKPNCLLVIWTYSVARISPAMDQFTEQLYSGILDGYWEKERKLVDEGYKSVKVPFEELFVPKFEMQAQWSLEQWMGYLQTWSAVQTYIKKNQSNPLEPLWPEFQKAWNQGGASAVRQKIQWPLAVRAFRVHS
jgi:ubiquinone/menaquinone biosynthesis C-methylase UbiE